MLIQAAEAGESLRDCLRAATRLESRSLILQATTLLALISDEQNSSERDVFTKQWGRAHLGDEEELSHHREQVRKIGEIVKLVGIRVVEGWR